MAIASGVGFLAKLYQLRIVLKPVEKGRCGCQNGIVRTMKGLFKGSDLPCGTSGLSAFAEAAFAAFSTAVSTKRHKQRKGQDMPICAYPCTKKAQ